MNDDTKQFLDEFEPDNTQPDILEQSLTPENGEEEQPNTEEEPQDDLKPRNRRERRLMAKLQSERESAMFLAGKLEAREDAKRAVSDEDADYLKGIERIYGTDSPEAQIASDLLKKAIVGARDDAERRAYERIKAEREQEAQSEREAEAQLDSIVDDLEDTYDVALTEAQQKSYFQLLQKMSPKDKDGSVVSLADPHAVWEVFQDRLQKRGTDNRAKNLSARSMVQSGTQSNSTLEHDALARQLREMDII